MRRLKLGLVLAVMLIASLCLSFACSGIFNDVDKVKHEFVSVSVNTAPDKTEYAIGETFSTNGLTLKAHCSFHNTDEDVSLSEVTVTYQNGTSFAYGDTKVTLTYKGLSVDVDITVICVDHQAGEWQKDDVNHWRVCSICGTKIESTETNHVYDAISVGGTYNTEYTAGETFDDTGLVVKKICSACEYETETEDYTVSYENGNAFASGDTKAIVTLNGTTVTYEIEVTVVANKGEITGSFTVANIVCGGTPAPAGELVANSGSEVYYKVSADGETYVALADFDYKAPEGENSVTLYIKAVADATADYTAAETEAQTFTVSHDPAAEWTTTDAEGHYHLCACGVKFDFAEHDLSFSNPSESTHAYTCDCGYQAVTDCSADSEDPYISDETGHWKICSDPNCNNVVGFAEHVPGEATIENGKSVVSCSVCGKEIESVNANAKAEVDLKVNEYGGTGWSGGNIPLDLSLFGDGLTLTEILLDDNSFNFENGAFAYSDVRGFAGTTKTFKLKVTSESGAVHNVTYEVFFITKGIYTYEDLLAIRGVSKAVANKTVEGTSDGSAWYDGYYKLYADIVADGTEWEGICETQSSFFTGTIDGNGHSVSGLKMTWGHWRMSFVGADLKGGVIKDIAFTDSVLKGNGSFLTMSGSWYTTAQGAPANRAAEIKNVFVSFAEIDGATNTQTHLIARSAGFTATNVVIDLSGLNVSTFTNMNTVIVSCIYASGATAKGIYVIDPNNFYKNNDLLLFTIGVYKDDGSAYEGNAFITANGRVKKLINNVYTDLGALSEVGLQISPTERVYALPAANVYGLGDYSILVGIDLSNPEWSEKLWTIDADGETVNSVPYYAPAVEKDDTPVAFVGIAGGDEVPQGTDFVIGVNKPNVRLILVSEITGVSLENNILRVSDVNVGEDITVRAVYAFDYSDYAEITLKAGRVAYSVNTKSQAKVNLNVSISEGALVKSNGAFEIDYTGTEFDNYLDYWFGWEGFDVVGVYMDGALVDGTATLSGKTVTSKTDNISANVYGAKVITVRFASDDYIVDANTTVTFITRNIATEADFNAIKDYVALLPDNGGYFNIVDDIVLTDSVYRGGTYTTENPASNFATPQVDYRIPVFAGTINGNGHVVSGMRMTGLTVIMTGWIIEAKGCTIENIAFTNVVIGYYKALIFKGNFTMRNLYLQVDSVITLEKKGATATNYQVIKSNGYASDSGILACVNTAAGTGTSLTNVVVDVAAAVKDLLDNGATTPNNFLDPYNSNYNTYSGAILGYYSADTIFDKVAIIGVYKDRIGHGSLVRFVNGYSDGASVGVYVSAYNDPTTNGVALPDSGWDEDVWYMAEGYIPVYKAVYDDTAVNFTNAYDGMEVRADSSLVLIPNRDDVTIEISELEGVTLDGRTVTVSASAEVGETFTITVTNVYVAENTLTITVNVTEKVISLNLETSVDVNLDASVESDEVVVSSESTFTLDLTEFADCLGETAKVSLKGAVLAEEAEIADGKITLNANLIDPLTVYGETEITVITRKGGVAYEIIAPVLVITKGIADVSDFTVATAVADLVAEDRTNVEITPYVSATKPGVTADVKVFGGYYKLLNDIMLDKSTLWSPVFSYGTTTWYASTMFTHQGEFVGTLDGGNHVIDNMVVKSYSGGFISVLGEGAVLKNIAFTNLRMRQAGTIIAKTTACGYGYGSGLSVDSIRIENVYVDVAAWGADSNGNQPTGAINIKNYTGAETMPFFCALSGASFSNVVGDFTKIAEVMEEYTQCGNNDIMFVKSQTSRYSNVAVYGIPDKDVSISENGNPTNFKNRVIHVSNGVSYGVYVAYSNGEDNGVAFDPENLDQSFWKVYESKPMPEFIAIVIEGLIADTEIDLDVYVNEGALAKRNTGNEYIDLDASIAEQNVIAVIDAKTAADATYALAYDSDNNRIVIDYSVFPATLYGERTFYLITDDNNFYPFKINFVTKTITTIEELTSSAVTGVGGVADLIEEDRENVAVTSAVTNDVKMFGGYFKLGADLEYTNLTQWKAIFSDETNGSIRWQGGDHTHASEFIGTLDGDGHVIDKLWLYGGNGNFSGFIKALGVGGTIKNLALTSVTIGPNAAVIDLFVATNAEEAAQIVVENVYVEVLAYGNFSSDLSTDLNKTYPNTWGGSSTFGIRTFNNMTLRNVVADYSYAAQFMATHTEAASNNNDRLFATFGSAYQVSKVTNAVALNVEKGVDGHYTNRITRFRTLDTNGHLIQKNGNTTTQYYDANVAVIYTDGTNNGIAVSATGWDSEYWVFGDGAAAPTFRALVNKAVTSVQEVRYDLSAEENELSSSADITVDFSELDSGLFGETADVYVNDVLVEEGAAIVNRTVTFSAANAPLTVFGDATVKIVTTADGIENTLTAPVFIVTKGIEDYEDLANLYKVVTAMGNTGYYKMYADVVNSGNADWTTPFTTLDNQTDDTAFSGTFDGAGHTIDGLIFNNGAATGYSNNLSLVGARITGTFKNVKIVNVNFKEGKAAVVANQGGIAAGTGASIENVYVHVSNVKASGNANIQAVFTRNGGRAIIKDCVVDLSETTFNDKFGFVAVGHVYDIGINPAGPHGMDGVYVYGIQDKMAFCTLWFNDANTHIVSVGGEWKPYTVVSGVWTESTSGTAKNFTKGVVGVYASLEDFKAAYAADTAWSISHDLFTVTSDVAPKTNISTFDQDFWGWFVDVLEAQEGDPGDGTGAVEKFTETAQEIDLDLTFTGSGFDRTETVNATIDLSEFSEYLGATANVYLDGERIGDLVNVSGDSVTFATNSIPVTTYGDKQIYVVTANGGTTYKITIPVTIISVTASTKAELDLVNYVALALGDGESVYGGYLKLTSDVDYEGATWAGLALGGTFEGVLDGGNHTISNIKFDADHGSFVGGKLTGTVKNVTFDGVTVNKVAIVAEEGEGATVKNVTISYTEFEAVNTDDGLTGGIFRTSMTGCSISDVTVIVNDAQVASYEGTYLGILSSQSEVCDSTITNVVVVDVNESTSADMNLYITYVTDYEALSYFDATGTSDAWDEIGLIDGISVVTSL